MKNTKRRNSRSTSVHLVGSLGGHLTLLVSAAEQLEPSSLVWITSAGVRADALRAEGYRVHELPRLDRGSLGLGSVLAGIRLALRERPTTVISSGAGLAVPFCLTARLLGARLIWLETMARVHSGSRTGQLLSRFSSDVVVQWPELAESTYPGALICQPTLLEAVTGEDAGAAGARSGTFVTVGSHDVAFGRLLEAVARAARAGVLPEPVFVQYGVGQLPDGPVTGTAWLTPEEFDAHVDAARVVVTHGGAGAISTALRSGRVPLVMSRSAELGEHVDDHQSEVVGKLEDMGLIVRVDQDFTAADVERADHAPVPPSSTAERPRLADALKGLLAGPASRV